MSPAIATKAGRRRARPRRRVRHLARPGQPRACHRVEVDRHDRVEQADGDAAVQLGPNSAAWSRRSPRVAAAVVELGRPLSAATAAAVPPGLRARAAARTRASATAHVGTTGAASCHARRSGSSRWTSASAWWVASRLGQSSSPGGPPSARADGGSAAPCAVDRRHRRRRRAPGRPWSPPARGPRCRAQHVGRHAAVVERGDQHQRARGGRQLSQRAAVTRRPGNGQRQGRTPAGHALTERPAVSGS